MELRNLGSSGLKVSVLSLGAMTFGESRTLMKGLTSEEEEARRVFDRAVECGVNLVDTANVYSEGRSEELTGRWIKGKRNKVLLATKCRFPIGFGMGGDKPGPHDMGLSRQHIMEACEASLRRLATDHIDLYQVHMQDTSVRIDETLRALDDLVRQGKVRYIGCSNYTGYRLTEALWAADRMGIQRYESAQIQWSLLERGAEREVVPACKAFRLGVLAWSPLANGFLSGKYRRGEPPPEGSRLAIWKDARKRLSTERSYDVLDRITEIARLHETSPAAVAIAWLMARPELTSVILGARTVQQLDDNLRALDVRLSAEELASLEEVSRPDWAYPYNFIGRMGHGW
ncbi:MAG: aldo/keto reductase [Myxococcales bacterium]|nr:aldo/keto reductase [Polyangiaceae bacterium]MDW8249805.1 aldo/keto reductase [Myxococcales bacterium]